MQTVKSVSWVRMVLAFGAVLLVAGSGLSLAAGPPSAYVPVSSIIVGPSTDTHSSTTPYTFVVTLNDGSTLSFPPTTGATFSAVVGSITQSGVYTAPATGTRDKISATYTQNGVTTSASRFIFLQ